MKRQDRGMIQLIDTHAHLCDAAFDTDLPQVLCRAGEAGVAAVVIVGETLADARKNCELAARYPGLLPAAGLYPAFAESQEADRVGAFIRSRASRLVAIGEVGLDFWIAKEEAERDIQREVFRSFIRLSLETGLPLNVHSRSAGRHVVAMLLEENAARVQLHGFDARAVAALPAVEAGYLFSIPPSIVRSRQKQKLVRQLPLSCLLVESDSPVLGPDPEKRNEPGNVVAAVDAIAAIKDVSREQVMEAVSENSVKLYGKHRENLLPGEISVPAQDENK